MYFLEERRGGVRIAFCCDALLIVLGLPEAAVTAVLGVVQAGVRLEPSVQK